MTPKGVYKVKSEEGQEETGYEEIEKEEEVKQEKIDFYLNQENWLHLSPELTKDGRLTKEEYEFAEDVEQDLKEQMLKQLSKLIVPATRLRPITQDKCMLIRRGIDEVLVVKSRW